MLRGQGIRVVFAAYRVRVRVEDRADVSELGLGMRIRLTFQGQD